MEKQWDEIRKLARAAAARDEQAECARRESPRNDSPHSGNPYLNIPTRQSPQHPPEGETLPFYWCKDTYKFFKSKQRLSLGMRYCGCTNYSYDYPDRRWDMARYWQPSPDPLCGYRKWIDQGIHPHDQWRLDCEEWDVKRDRERREEVGRNEEHNERIRRETQAHLEVCRRREREKNREMTAKAKAAGEE